MGHKKICTDCQISFNRDFDSGLGLRYPCPSCGKPMELLPHRFRPPRKEDNKGWVLVKFLIESGFPYQHITENDSEKFDKISNAVSFAKYPKNMHDAIEFIEKYKNQAFKKNQKN